MSQSRRIPSAIAAAADTPRFGHWIEGGLANPRPLAFRFDGKPLQGLAGDTLASALLANNIRLVGRSFKYHRPRGLLSAGCEEPNALVGVGGHGGGGGGETNRPHEPNQRATQVALHEGLNAVSQNRWPSLRWDASAALEWGARILPAGFYYKTFLWPSSLWHPVYERMIRRMAGLGRLETKHFAKQSADTPIPFAPDDCEQIHLHCDVLVVGAGIAGIAAAKTAADADMRVLLVDENPHPGGRAWEDEEKVQGKPAHEWARQTLAEIQSRGNLIYLPRATAVGHYDHNFALVLERVSEHDPEQASRPGAIRRRLWRVRPKRIVLASGALERPLLFAHNDRPGVMLSASVRAYLRRYGVAPGARAVVVTCHDDAYLTALDLKAAGAQVAAIVDLRAAPADQRLSVRAQKEGIPVRTNSALWEVEGRLHTRAALIGRLRESGRPALSPERVACDLIAMSGGFAPANHLWSHAGGRLCRDEARGLFLPEEHAQGMRAAGAVRGIEGCEAIRASGEEEGHLAVESILSDRHLHPTSQEGGWSGKEKEVEGADSPYEGGASLGTPPHEAAAQKGSPTPAPLPSGETPPHPSHAASHGEGASFGMPVRNGSDQKGGWAGKFMGGVGGFAPHMQATQASRLIPGRGTNASGRKHFLDFQNDVTVADIELAAREGYRSVELLKRYTTLGMATDQGKTSNMNALDILSDCLGAAPGTLGTTTFRPPYTPLPLDAIIGMKRGDLFLPRRRTPITSWHEANGADMECVGQWLRPFCYPRGDESRRQAIDREIAATRASAGMIDLSTLGKIEVSGPDAAEFLDRIYATPMARLPLAKCRYGLMLNENGFLFDDGVVARLADDRFLLHATSGNADSVYAWLEEWHQTEWFDLDLFITNVSEQWAQIALAGPRAREILQSLPGDIDFAPDAFPFLAMREGRLADTPARIYRISFTGELSYEIAVPAAHGRAMWETLLAAGEQHSITAFGTEPLHVMRAEKGFIAIGDETDGQVTPLDLGLGWAVSKKKADFIGKRSLERSHLAADGRPQLTGLLTEDESLILPDGAQAVAGSDKDNSRRSIGHVTSSYWSPTLGRSIALALIEGARARQGELVTIALEGGDAQAKMVDGAFFDPKGERQNV